MFGNQNQPTPLIKFRVEGKRSRHRGFISEEGTFMCNRVLNRKTLHSLP